MTAPAQTLDGPGPGAPHEPSEPEARGPRHRTVVLAGVAIVAALSVVVVLALAASVRHATGFASDDFRILREFRRHKNPHVVHASRLLADFGSIDTLVMLGIGAGVLLRLRGLRAILCAVPLASLLVAGGFVEVMKVTIARVGPNARLQFGPPSTGSFPSGHSADVTALSVGLAIVLVAVLLRSPVLRVAVCAAALALSGAVGISRLVLGVHWPTDVVAGWATGLGTALAIGTFAVLFTEGRPFVDRSRSAPTRGSE
jgi:undecaprenyl-diphosphatase